MTNTILVVEDDDDLRNIIQWGLEADGFQVRTAADGHAALAAVALRRPDLVVLDWEMPLLNGLEVCTRLRQDEVGPALPVVMVTGRFEPDNVRRGIDAGADAYVTKPFAVDALADQIRRVLARSAADSAEPAEPDPDPNAAQSADQRPADQPSHSDRRRVGCRARNARTSTPQPVGPPAPPLVSGPAHRQGPAPDSS